MAEKNTLEFRALLLVNKERSVYGLRYNDFQRYRKHCTNRVHRLRSSLKLTHGKGKEFKKLPPIGLDSIKNGHLHLILFESERAWSYSQELMEVFSKSQESADRRQAMGRLRRAQLWSSKLLEQCKALHTSGRLPSEHYTQVIVYHLLIKGRLERIRENYETGLSHLSVARLILDELATLASNSHDQAVATVFIDEIAPEIRHCAHSLGHKKAYDIDGIVKEIGPRFRQTLVPDYDTVIKSTRKDLAEDARSAAKQQLGALEWEGATVTIRNPEVVDAFVKVEVASKKLYDQSSVLVSSKGAVNSRKRITAFDGVLQALSDAEIVSRKISEARALAGGDEAAPKEPNDIRFVHSYITYQLLCRRTERDLLLVNTLTSDDHSTSVGQSVSKSADTTDPRVYAAVVKIYDNMLQNMTQMRSLFIVDDSADISAGTDARIAYVKAQRCLYMARAYAGLKRHAEAVSLTQTGKLRVREIQYQISLLSNDSGAIPEMQYFALDSKQVSEIASTLEEEESKIKENWFAYNGGSLNNESDSFQKPLFYDIAVNSVQLPLSHLQHRAGRKPQEKQLSSATSQQQASKAELDDNPADSAVPEAPRTGVLGSLLGGWWGRK